MDTAVSILTARIGELTHKVAVYEVVLEEHGLVDEAKATLERTKMEFSSLVEASKEKDND